MIPWRLLAELVPEVISRLGIHRTLDHVELGQLFQKATRPRNRLRALVPASS
jgi:hypothetical protein